MKYPDLLLVWAVSITWCTAFLIAVSFYLYHRRKRIFPENVSVSARLKGFIFVFVLTFLLGLYILSINLASSLVFAIGNIIVEIFLVFYGMRNKTGATTKAAAPPQASPDRT